MDRETVNRIAELARLEIPEARRDAVAAELTRILEFVATLDRLDAAGDPPLPGVACDGGLREDREDGRRLGAEAALAGAPEADDGFFVVPPVVEHLEP